MSLFACWFAYLGRCEGTLVSPLCSVLYYGTLSSLLGTLASLLSPLSSHPLSFSPLSPPLSSPLPCLLPPSAPSHCALATALCTGEQMQAAYEDYIGMCFPYRRQFDHPRAGLFLPG